MSIFWSFRRNRKGFGNKTREYVRGNRIRLVKDSGRPWCSEGRMPPRETRVCQSVGLECHPRSPPGTGPCRLSHQQCCHRRNATILGNYFGCFWRVSFHRFRNSRSSVVDIFVYLRVCRHVLTKLFLITSHVSMHKIKISHCNWIIVLQSYWHKLEGSCQRIASHLQENDWRWKWRIYC